MKPITALKLSAASLALTASFAANATCNGGCPNPTPNPPPAPGTTVNVPVNVGVGVTVPVNTTVGQNTNVGQNTTVKNDLTNQQAQQQSATALSGSVSGSSSTSGVVIGKDAIKTGDQNTVVGVKTGDTNVGVKTGDTHVKTGDTIVKTGDTLVKQGDQTVVQKAGDQTVGPVTQKAGDVTNDNSYSNTTNYKAAASSAYAAGGPAHYSNGCNMSGVSFGAGVQTVGAGATVNFSTGMHFDKECWKANNEQWQEAQTINSGKVGAATVIGTWIKADPAKLETAKDVAAKMQGNPHQQDPLALLFGVQAAAPKEPAAPVEPKPTTFTNTIYVGVDGKPVTPPVCQDGSLKGKPAIYSPEAKAFICN